jgi:hypothetical protein
MDSFRDILVLTRNICNYVAIEAVKTILGTPETNFFTDSSGNLLKTDLIICD